MTYRLVLFRSRQDGITFLTLSSPTLASDSQEGLTSLELTFVAVLLHGRRSGPPGTPVAFETCLGWVLAGSMDVSSPTEQITTCHVSCLMGDDILCKFWEIEDSPLSEASLSPEEPSTVQHFKTNHRLTENGRFIVPRPRRENAKPPGESQSQAVRRFLSL